MEPPHIVHARSSRRARAAVERLHCAHLDWIRRRSAARAATDVEKRETCIPERSEQNPVTNEYIVDKRIPHWAYRGFNRICGVGDVDNCELSKVATTRIHRQKRVVAIVDAAELHGMNTLSGGSTRVPRQQNGF